MSTQTQDSETTEMGTKPSAEHEWLKKLLGEWTVVTEMYMDPSQPPMKVSGTDSVKSLGGLWAFSESKAAMPDGTGMEIKAALGYDVSFKEYRGCWFASMSSHLWKQTGSLSSDGKTMTLNCVGPNMEKDGETANYRDVIEIIDENHRTLTSYAEDENGEFKMLMKSHYTRV